MSPPLSAAGASEAAMTINSTSIPFAVKIPQSFAAKSGKAVIVKPAFDILTFERRSWLPALLDSNPSIPRRIMAWAGVHHHHANLDSGSRRLGRNHGSADHSSHLNEFLGSISSPFRIRQPEFRLSRENGNPGRFLSFH